MSGENLVRPEVRTDHFRRSEAKDSHGRTIWKYQQTSAKLAQTFLERQWALVRPPQVEQQDVNL